MYRSSQSRGSWRSAVQAIPDSNVVLFPRLPDGCVFSFQSSASQVAPADDFILEEIPAFPEGRGGHLCPYDRPSEGILPFTAILSTKNAPAGFGRSEVDVLKFFSGWWWKNSGCCDRIDTSKTARTDSTTEALR